MITAGSNPKYGALTSMHSLHSNSDGGPQPPRCRVLYVQRPSGGGSATGLFELVRRLDTRVYEPLVLFYEPNYYVDRFREIGVRVLLLNDHVAVRSVTDTSASGKPSRSRATDPIAGQSKAVRSLRGATSRRLARLIRDERIDLVHHNNNPRANRASIVAARLAGVPQVCHVRFLANYRVVDRVLARWVDFFIYMSNAIQQDHRRRGGSRHDKGGIIYDVYDLTAYASAAEAAHRVRAELNLNDSDPVVSNVGRLVEWKGQDVFLHAVAELVRSNPRLRVLIVGEPGPDSASRTYARHLRELTEELGLVNHVVFTGFRSDVAEIMAASDVVVHSATQPEPFGRVVVEAMAAARPVIATAGGGVLDIIRDGETGILVPLGDADRMAGALRQLLADPAAAQRMGRQAQKDVHARFSADTQIQTLHGVYQRILRRRPATASVASLATAGW